MKNKNAQITESIFLLVEKNNAVQDFSMPDPRRVFGTEMEESIATYLEKKGYRVLARQHRTSYGEIDLVCLDDTEVVFVEVKARRSHAYGYPEESVSPAKVQRLARCAQAYMQTQNPQTYWRIDVIAVECEPTFQITHLKNIDIPNRF